MPNWCENDLTIKAKTRKRLDDVMAFVHGHYDDGDDEEVSPFDFNVIIPYPEIYRKMDEEADNFKGRWEDRPKDGFNSGGYEWRVDNWGTKWPASEIWVEDLKTDGSCVVHFSTAWTPPLPIIDKLAEAFPDISFMLRYYEGGMGFSGKYDGRGVDVLNRNYKGQRGG